MVFHRSLKEKHTRNLVRGTWIARNDILFTCDDKVWYFTINQREKNMCNLDKINLNNEILHFILSHVSYT